MWGGRRNSMEKPSWPITEEWLNKLQHPTWHIVGSQKVFIEWKNSSVEEKILRTHLKDKIIFQDISSKNWIFLYD